MNAIILFSAAAISSAQPLPTSDDFVGPVQDVTPAVAAARSEDNDDGIWGSSGLAMELPQVANGAKLRLRWARLKLKVPM